MATTKQVTTKLGDLWIAAARDPQTVCDLLSGVLHASYRLTAADRRDHRRTDTPRAEKRRAVDRLFRYLFGRKATEEEHVWVGTNCVSYGGY